MYAKKDNYSCLVALVCIALAILAVFRGLL